MYESLSLFSEPTKMWFEHAFGQPTEAQAQAWPAIHSGRNVLVIAPTGSGKTLAAFLSAIDRLMTVPRTRRAGVRCAVYLAVKGARGRCGQEPRTAFGGHCCTMRGARAARAEDRGRHSFRRHHRTGAGDA